MKLWSIHVVKNDKISFLFYDWIMEYFPFFVCIYRCHTFFVWIYWWTLSLYPYLGYCKQCCSERCSFVQLCPTFVGLQTPWTAASQTSLPLTISQSLLKLMSIESVRLSNHLVICHPLLFLPSIFPSVRVFPNELTLCIMWPKYWSFSLSISPSNEYSGLFSFRIDWFDL